MDTKTDRFTKRTGFIPVIFGGTGDLTARKLVPALFSLFAEGKINDGFAAVLTGRREQTREGFLSHIRDSIRSFSRIPAEGRLVDDFCSRIIYHKLDFVSDRQGYRDLDALLRGLDEHCGTHGNRLYYLAVSPDYFGCILENLHENGMLEGNGCFRRILAEKPFGYSLATARSLNAGMRALVKEENIYRIDHYLGKEMIHNIVAIRFGNTIFESLWNSRHIDNVQITVSEQLGVGSRGGYYDKTGVLKDMVQNHILQMLALIAMEPPARMTADSLRAEKVKVLKALTPYDRESAARFISRGQYGDGSVNGIDVPGYRKEEKVDTLSDTDTFIAFRITIDNERWKGVPFYIRTGKRLDTRRTEIVIQFRSPGDLGFEPFKNAGPNLLVFAIQPLEGFYFRINKMAAGEESRIGRIQSMEPIYMDYCHSCRMDVNSPESYESLLQEAVCGNPSSFISWEELESSWEYIESIENSLKDLPVFYPNYPSGSGGPPGAEELLKSEGRHWWDMNYDHCIRERIKKAADKKGSGQKGSGQKGSGHENYRYLNDH